MAIYGIGTDIIEIDRFKRDGKPLGERFMERCFTEEEREHLASRRPENIAGYFAAKEAIAKALGTGFTGFSPSAIEIKHNEGGKPEAVLHDKAAQIAQSAAITQIHISISHNKSHATAMAVAEI